MVRAAQGALEGVLQAVAEQGAVGQAGQGVVQGVVRELLLGLHALGDVADALDGPDDRPLGVEQRGSDDREVRGPAPQALHGNLRAQGAAHAGHAGIELLQGRIVLLGSQHHVDEHWPDLAVKRLGVGVPVLADHLLSTHPGDPHDGPVPGDDAAGAVDDKGGVGQKVQDVHEALLGFPEQALGVLALLYLPGQRAVALGQLLGALRNHALQLQVEPRQLLVVGRHLARVGLLELQGADDAAARGLHVLGHVVEALGQLAEFVLAVHADPRAQPPLGQGLDALAQDMDGPGEGIGHHEAQGQGQKQGRGHGDEHQPGGVVDALADVLVVHQGHERGHGPALVVRQRSRSHGVRAAGAGPDAQGHGLFLASGRGQVQAGGHGSALFVHKGAGDGAGIIPAQGEVGAHLVLERGELGDAHGIGHGHHAPDLHGAGREHRGKGPDA